MRTSMRNKFFKIPLFILLGIGGVALLGLLLMSLWNALLPGLFHAPEITFWQALGLFILAKLLFGGMHSGHHARGIRRRHYGKRFEERLANMTPEEREKFKSQWHHCGWGPDRYSYDDKDENTGQQ